MAVLTLTRNGPVATLTLQRPAVHNAFNPDVIAGITEVCHEMRADPVVRVLVLQGEGPSFCAGADLNWMRNSLAYSQEENIADATRLDAMFTALDMLPQAVVARVHGAALGGGVGLVCCADYAVAAEDAVFGLTEVRLGLLPAVIARFVVARVGFGHARALFVTGRRVKAAQALAMGLVHEVVPADQLDAAVDAVVADLLRGGPQAIAASKALLRAVRTEPLAEARRLAIEAIAAARTGAEGQAGLRAFLERQPPPWSPG
ncbi:enoyl-CoA hydratase-related protein [Chloroflexus sp.]|uniref:enoyl-CoA hydratase-related protein n=1 Tax=Chloroflexus sp. TaxID=1904827 RepID=UPI00298F066E|nr:enoyl-CoA hydratase-related protein [Chloroflexus sp.]MCX7860439.1 enoyl-CoA hydratase-related protein [Chloroflexus sp.]MDW8405067.1 enoyl-CoA hydratase-related protein [Chloroflexus sp.]